MTLLVFACRKRFVQQKGTARKRAFRFMDLARLDRGTTIAVGHLLRALLKQFLSSHSK